MSLIYPKFDEDGNLLVEDVFWEKYFEYANEHNFNVVFTSTHFCGFVDCVNAFRKAGYKDTLLEVPCKFEGLELKPYLHCKFERMDNELTKKFWMKGLIQ